MFQRNSTIHSFHTRHCSDLHRPQVNLTKVQKGLYNPGIKAYNCLPAGIKDLSNNFESFKCALKKLLLENSLYTSPEYFNCAASNK